MKIINKFSSIRKGVSFNGRDIKFYTGTGVSKTPLDIVGASIEMNFKNSEEGSVIFSFKTADNSITITAPGVARMMPRVMNYQKNNYLTDIVLTFPSGTVKNYVRIYWEIN